MSRARYLGHLLCGALLILLAPVLRAQHTPLDPPIPTDRESPKHRQHLILRDGSFQVVVSYKIVGDAVHYISAERAGAEEEIPLRLVDLPATERWAREHAPGFTATTPQGPASVLSPELAKDEAARAARTPLVAPDLHLPEEDSVLVLDNFHGTPELVPLAQRGSDLNRETAHAVISTPVNPDAAPHRIGSVKDPSADVQVHVPDPVFFVRLHTKADDEDEAEGGAFTVDTQGQSGRATPSGGSVDSRYVLERVDVRQDSRVIDSFRLWQLGDGLTPGKPQRDIVEFRAQTMPGGRWLKLTPTQPLDFGEYALIEILNDHTVNLGVWDLGVHPDASENAEALRPEPPRRQELNRRRGTQN